ncbi:MAG: 50S ribosomal protein L35 [Acidimicrobiia bacterium]
MPKMKTNRSAVKRFKVTGTGKILRRKSYRSHLLEYKPSKRTRRLGRLAEVTGGQKVNIEKLIGRR